MWIDYIFCYSSILRGSKARAGHHNLPDLHGRKEYPSWLILVYGGAQIDVCFKSFVCILRGQHGNVIPTSFPYVTFEFDEEPNVHRCSFSFPDLCGWEQNLGCSRVFHLMVNVLVVFITKCCLRLSLSPSRVHVQLACSCGHVSIVCINNVWLYNGLSRNDAW